MPPAAHPGVEDAADAGGAAGGRAYPLPLDELAREADPAAGTEVISQALKEKTLKPHLLIALPGQEDTPVALADDAARLADWPPLLEAALAAARTPENQAVAVKDLKKKVAKPLQSPFGEALKRRLREWTLPAGIGVLLIKRNPVLFLLADVNAEMPPPHPQPLSPEAGERGEDRLPVHRSKGEVPLSFSPLPCTRGEGLGVRGQSLSPEAGESEAALVDFAQQSTRHSPGWTASAAGTTSSASSRCGRRSMWTGKRLTPVCGAAREGATVSAQPRGGTASAPKRRDAGIVEDGSLLLFASRKGL